MDIIKSPLHFKSYCAEKILFEVNYDFDKNDDKVVEIEPVMTKEISEPEEREFYATIHFSIKNEENPKSLPFSLEISITGFFELDTDDPDCKDHLVINNSIVILLPYLRALITTITAGANIPPLVLPVLDLSNIFIDE